MTRQISIQTIFLAFWAATAILDGISLAVPVEFGTCYDDLPMMLTANPGSTIAYWEPSSNPHIAATGHVALLCDGYILDSRYGKLSMDAFGKIDHIFYTIEELDAYITIKI
jgi:hypothetical protein